MKTIKEKGLQDKLPSLFLVNEVKYDFLPVNYFDVVYAHSVFTHLPLDIIQACLREVKEVLKPTGFFEFTFFSSEKKGSFLKEDFYYPEDEMLAVVKREGYSAHFMDDWEYPQRKIRAHLLDKP